MDDEAPVKARKEKMASKLAIRNCVPKESPYFLGHDPMAPRAVMNAVRKIEEILQAVMR